MPGAYAAPQVSLGPWKGHTQRFRTDPGFQDQFQWDGAVVLQRLFRTGLTRRLHKLHFLWERNPSQTARLRNSFGRALTPCPTQIFWDKISFWYPTAQGLSGTFQTGQRPEGYRVGYKDSVPKQPLQVLAQSHLRGVVALIFHLLAVNTEEVTGFQGQGRVGVTLDGAGKLGWERRRVCCLQAVTTNDPSENEKKKKKTKKKFPWL